MKNSDSLCSSFIKYYIVKDYKWIYKLGDLPSCVFACSPVSNMLGCVICISPVTGVMFIPMKIFIAKKAKSVFLLEFIA